MTKRILQLDNQLANQIAAGEVVERPASVVKELLENCVDAGAARISIDIERGGARLIRISDDGHGIHKDDMALALSRHATSKISQFSELCAVESLGFRGEALASIASVSKLLLRSRTKGQEQGWQAIAEGRDMTVDVRPAVATEGTCVEVRDLFYNTPARRKFLRTEKTEFTHIEDVVKREALAALSVAFVLKNNGTTIKRYPAAKNSQSMQQKLMAACGARFVKQAMEFAGEIDSLSIHGWIGAPSYHRSESDTQLIFVNNRPVKDRMLSHAVRQSYAGLIPAGRFATYVIYIECPANLVDVNVHPTKHEVKFAQPRQVHDFLVKLVSDSLQRGLWIKEKQLPASQSDVHIPRSDLLPDNPSEHQLIEQNDTAQQDSENASLNSQQLLNQNQHISVDNSNLLLTAVTNEEELTSNFDAADDSEQSTHHYSENNGVREDFSRPLLRNQTPLNHTIGTDKTKNGITTDAIAEHRSFYQKVANASVPVNVNSDAQKLKETTPTVRKNDHKSLWQQRYLVYPLQDELWLIDVWRWAIGETKHQWGVTRFPMKPLLIPKALNIKCQDQFEDASVFEQFFTLGIELTPCSPEQLLLRKLPAITTPISEDVWLKALQSYLQNSQHSFGNVTSIQEDILACLQNVTPENTESMLSWCNLMLAKETSQNTGIPHPNWQSYAWSISVQELAQKIG